MAETVSVTSTVGQQLEEATSGNEKLPRGGANTARWL